MPVLQDTDWNYTELAPVAYEQADTAVAVEDTAYDWLQDQGYNPDVSAVSRPRFSLTSGLAVPTTQHEPREDTPYPITVEVSSDSTLEEELDETSFAVVTFYPETYLEQ